MMSPRCLLASALCLVSVAATAAPGSLDPTFNGSGWIALNADDGRGETVCLDNQGRIAIAASRLDGSAYRAYLLRLSASGVLDTGFGGWRPIGASSAGFPQSPAIVCASDRYAVASVEAPVNNVFPVRLDIVPHSGTGASSSLLNQGLNGWSMRVGLTQLISNSWIIAAGLGSGPATGALQRWDGANAPLSFQGTYSGNSGTQVSYREVLVGADGNLYAIGRRTANNTQGVAGVVSSFNSAGQLRTSFANNGHYLQESAGDDYGQRLAPSLQSGKFYAAFQELGPSLQQTIRVQRLNFNGTLDASFTGASGLFRPGELGDLIEDAQGRVLLAGRDEQGAAFVTRFTANGIVDFSFGVQGTATFGFGSTGASFRGITLDAQGRIILVGARTETVRGNSIVPDALIVARLLP